MTRVRNLFHRVGVISVGLISFAPGQRNQEEVPLMRPSELKVVEEQSEAFNEALLPVIKDAAQSTVRVWGQKGRRGAPKLLSYGTVIGGGNQIITKFSEVVGALETLQVQTGSGRSFQTEVAGVFTDEDLVLLNLLGSGQGDPAMEMPKPASFFEKDLQYGQFLTSPQPNGRLGAFGVVSVLERNLRESDQAHLGILADGRYRGEGVRIASVQPEFGAAEAGMQTGDVILAIDDREISGLLELKNALTGKQPGDKVSIKIESAGKERVVEVMLSNRPVQGQFAGNRLNQMERMGGEPNRVRTGFSDVVQSDMKINKNQVGGPVVDLEGRIVGITMARADRTRTYIMGSKTLMSVLKRESDTVAEAQEKFALEKERLANQRRAIMPRRSQGRPRDLGRAKRHLSDVERLRNRLRREFDALDLEKSP
ncbi:MAG: PDZ domain-containing protein [Akkermansiaceae bacterium]